TPLMLPAVEPPLVACLYACLCSFALDYAARQKVGGTHLKFHPMKQLPVLPPSTYAAEAPWQRGLAVRDWIVPRVLELTYTAWDLEPFAKDCGEPGPPFIWDPARRFRLRCELDAAFFHLYGISREDADYILDTFPIVRKHDENAHGEYRTKRVILEIYEALAEASRTGKPYVSPLGPPRRAR
ncbi:MAG: restriction endonuclease, partial [Myxococcales bacterium]|nr:restriction endonuclease [Myxococcales bacterium]